MEPFQDIKIWFGWRLHRLVKKILTLQFKKILVPSWRDSNQLPFTGKPSATVPLDTIQPTTTTFDVIFNVILRYVKSMQLIFCRTLRQKAIQVLVSTLFCSQLWYKKLFLLKWRKSSRSRRRGFILNGIIEESRLFLTV